MSIQDEIYSFAFKGWLTQEAIADTPAMEKYQLSGHLDQSVAERLPLDLLDEDLVARARRMATVYTAVGAFENSVRAFVAKKLLEEKGENWWEEAVSEKIRKKADSRKDEEEKIRWHTQRGDEALYFTDFGELVSIIIANWNLFEPHMESLDWVKQMLKTVERSRNVIMHSGYLQNEDIERVGSCIRDWIRQVGG